MKHNVQANNDFHCNYEVKIVAALWIVSRRQLPFANIQWKIV